MKLKTREIAGVKSVHTDFLKWEPEAGEQFDVITLNKVLEHVEDPITMMAHARNWIRPGGFLYIEVPDVRAAKEGPGREEFYIEHLHVFSIHSMQIISKAANLVTYSSKSLKEKSGKFTIYTFMTRQCT